MTKPLRFIKKHFPIRRIWHWLRSIVSRLVTFIKNCLRRSVVWWRRYDHRWFPWWRIANGGLAVLMLAGVALSIVSVVMTNRSYQLTPAARQLVGSADQTLVKQLKWDKTAAAWTYNVTVPPGTPAPVAAMFRAQTGSATSGGPYSLTIYQDPKQGVEYTDTNTGLSFSLQMESNVRPGRLVESHLVFPMDGGKQAIYTLHSTGLKEDIYLPSPSKYELSVYYRLKLPKTLQAKALTDGSGSIGIYGADPVLFTATGTSGTDEAALEKAREQGDKTNLVFVLPRPFVKEPSGAAPKVINSRYEFYDDQLVAIADGLNHLTGPASLDPTVTFTSASDFATNGNNEGMTSYDSTNGRVNRGTVTGGYLGTVPPPTAAPVVASIGTAGTGTSVSIPPPSGVANGSLVVAYVWGERSNTTAFTISGPAGWTSYTQQNYSANSHRWVFAWFYHYASGSETTNYAFTASGVTYTAAGGYAMRITGGPTDGSNPFVDSSHQTMTTTANAATNVTGWTPGDNYSLLLAGKTSSTSTISTLPTGWTNDATSTITTVAHTAQTTAAATGTLTFRDAASATRGVVIVTIRPPVDNDIWQYTTDLPNGVENTTAIAYNGYLYQLGGDFVGGTDFQMDVLYAQINADGSIGDWNTGSTILEGHKGGFLVTIDSGYMYVINGNTSQQFIYAKINTDGSLGSFTSTTAPATREFFGVVAYNGYMYVLGGDDGTNYLSDVQYAPIYADGQLGSWTSTANLTAAINSVSAVAYNGYIYAIGGGNDGGYKNTAYYAPINADGSLGNWMATSSFAIARATNPTVAYNGYMYILGGYNGSQLADVQYAPIYANGSLGNWVTTANYNGGNTSIGGGVGIGSYNGYLYLVGGGNVGGPMQRVLYTQISAEPSSGAGLGNTGAVGQWQFGTALPTGRTDIAGTSYNGYIYTVGGYGDSGYQNTDYAQINADGSIGEWSAAASLNDPRQGARTVAYNGYLYALGGQLANRDPIDSVEYTPIHADGSLGVWQNTTNLTAGRYRLGAVAYNGYMYVLGGGYDWNNGYSYNDVEYAPINSDGSISTWHSTTSLTVNRSDFGAVAYNGYMYVLGGSDDSGILNNVEYTHINNDGSLGSWSETSGLVGAVSSLNTFGYDGYLYAVGGDQENTSYSNVQYASINANGSIGSWTQTTAFSTNRGSFGAAISNGYFYVYGGWSGYDDSDIQYAPINSIARTGHYSKLIDLGTTVNFGGVAYEGLIPPGTGSAQVTYRTAGIDGIFGASQNAIIGTSANSSIFGCWPGAATVRYVWVSVTLDDSYGQGQSGAFPDAGTPAYLADLTVGYNPVHPSPNIRLRTGQTLQAGVLSPLDTCIATDPPKVVASAETAAAALSSGQTETVALPASTDQPSLVVVMARSHRHASQTSAVFTASSGWVMGPEYFSANCGDLFTQEWFYKYFPPGDNTASMTLTANYNVDDGGALALRIVGGPTSGNPFVDQIRTIAYCGGDATSPGFTPQNKNSLMLVGMATETGQSINLNSPPSWTWSGIGASGLGFGYKTQTVAMPTGDFGMSASADLNAIVATIRGGGPTDMRDMYLVEQYKLNGNTTDSINSSYSAVGTDITPVTGADGVANHAYSFNGTSSQIADDTNLWFLDLGISIGGWVYSNSSGSGGDLFGQNDMVEMGMSDSTHIWAWVNGNDDPLYATVSANTWHQVYLTYDAVSWNLYVDGVLAGSQAHNWQVGSDYHFNIGAGVSDPTGNYFNGRIDDVRVYDIALSASQITSIYSQGAQ